jgi:hypothetical protein
MLDKNTDISNTACSKQAKKVQTIPIPLPEHSS